MNELDYYITTDNASKIAYDIGDMIRELPYRKKKDKASAQFLITNIKTHLEGLSVLINKLEE